MKIEPVIIGGVVALYVVAFVVLPVLVSIPGVGLALQVVGGVGLCWLALHIMGSLT